MVETNKVAGHTGKAAVVVIDNQFGVNMGPAIIPPEPLNDIWEQITIGLLKMNYDEVIVIKGHHPEFKDNPIVEAVNSETKRFGSVDMFTMMHTNMLWVDQERITDLMPGLAQLPLKLFLDSISPEQRSHLNHLYSMGCEDGNFMAASLAAELGFKIYSGHEGSTFNNIATFAFLKRVFEGELIKDAASETNTEMQKCLPQIGEVVDKSMGVIRESFNKYLDCQKNSPSAQCIASVLPGLLPALKEISDSALQCIPSIKEEWSYIGNPASSFFNLLPEKKMFAGLSNEMVLKELLPKNAKEKATNMAEKMRLITFGEESAPMKPLSREEMIKRILDFVRDKNNIDYSKTGKILLAVAILAELGEKETLREMYTILPVDMYAIRNIVLKKLFDLKDVTFLREYLMKPDDTESFTTVVGYLLSLGDAKYLVDILHSETTPPRLRRELAEIFIRNGNYEAIKGLGRFFEENGMSTNGLKQIWERSKQDATFAEEYNDEITSLLSVDNLWCDSHTDLYFEMADKSPELLVKASQKTAVRLATNPVKMRLRDSDAQRIMFTVALLFDKGKISEETAKALLGQSRISADEACALKGSFNNFYPYPILQRLLGPIQ